jgi:2-keto-3-deoxy-L-fuconate dehydrogenase
MTTADLDGLSALVTGGASGIGLAIATELAARGARVVVLDRPKERPADLTTELGFVTGDISDADSVRRAVHAAADQLGVPGHEVGDRRLMGGRPPSAL